MNENETDPRPADAVAGDSAARVESEQPTAAQPTIVPPTAAPQSAAPHNIAAAQPQPAQPQPAQEQFAQPQPTQPVQPQPPAAPQSPWAPWQQQAPQQQAPQDPAAQPTSAQPAYAQPASGQPYSSATDPVTGQPYGYGQPYQGYQAPQGYAGYQQTGYQDYAQQAAYAGAWQPGGTQTAEGVVPPWAGGDQRPQRSGRGRKIFLAGAAAVLIALGAGGVGAATALALDDGSTPQSVQTGNSSVTRVVDRSSLAEIAAAVQDSVVSITTGSGEGSGVVLSADGYIVTNNHVVSTATGGKVNIIFADGTKATAEVVGTDARTDLAVVKASGVSGLKAAKFADSSQIQVGDTVLALGSPLGLEGSVTAGIISAKDRTIQSASEDEQEQTPSNPFGGSQEEQQQQQQSTSTTMTGLLQTDAPINPGNSGGALVNTNGEVVGINSAIATSGSSSGNIGLGFAIPSNKAADVANQLMAGKKVSHPALGVSVTDGENGGALVSTVTADSAASKAGLQQGDVVTKVDGKTIDESDDLVAAVQAGSVGQKLSITFTRNGSEQTVTVTLQEAQ
ncbi:putative serine protease PepD [Actinoplanes lutulentus]|uniref:Putative serine protease PepD n=1 Tax=Actinoplanes lutulentus TaxID=1287878 RepID=A0A327Z8E8_9ACTN|nr:trypsin-like peptidase domain-containing protein [Actinoplanes lutulentus]MBB2946211.1 putative serine protease PepD [Actinoplanes lutulentus]RAK32900.1 putative serine protease PepD [Actinoplanes lutulentus]